MMLSLSDAHQHFVSAELGKLLNNDISYWLHATSCTWEQLYYLSSDVAALPADKWSSQDSLVSDFKQFKGKTALQNITHLVDISWL